MESLCIRCLVEIEVATENLVSPFTAEHHLDAHAADDSCQQIHRSGCTHRRHIVSFRVVNHIADGIQTLLHRIVHLVVHCADMLCHLLCLRQVGRALQSYGERVQLGPPRIVLVIGLNAFCSIQFSDG